MGAVPVRFSPFEEPLVLAARSGPPRASIPAMRTSDAAQRCHISIGENAAVRGSHRRCRAVTVPAMRTPAAMPWAGAVTSPAGPACSSRARPWQPSRRPYFGPADGRARRRVGRGPCGRVRVGRVGAADFAVRLRACPRGRDSTDDAARRALCIRLRLGGVAVPAVFIVGGVAGYMTEPLRLYGGARWPVSCSSPWSVWRPGSVSCWRPLLAGELSCGI